MCAGSAAFSPSVSLDLRRSWVMVPPFFSMRSSELGEFFGALICNGDPDFLLFIIIEITGVTRALALGYEGSLHLRHKSESAKILTPSRPTMHHHVAAAMHLTPAVIIVNASESPVSVGIP